MDIKPFTPKFVRTMAENFVVSALKYRPQTFSTVIGQEHITSTLKNAIANDQLAHAFLFCGPRGVGKTTCARILAKTINCTNRTSANEACDACDSCVGYQNNSGFNVHELDAASNNSVENIRDLVEQVRYAPQAGSKYKVYIIDEVHMLTTNAFNAFLKTLEEPPAHAIFILATTEKHKILPTILSRCQIFDFKRINTKDTVSHLQAICAEENIPAQEDALHFIALKSEGCMRDALSIMDKIVSFSNGSITYESTIENLNILDYDYFFKVTEGVLIQDNSAVLLMYDDILSKGFEGDMFLSGLMEHLRNLMVCKDAQTVKLMDIAEGLKKRYHTQANSVEYNVIINALSILNDSEINYKMARNKRLHVELALIKLCNLQHAIEIISGPNGETLKKKLVNNFITPIFKRVNKKQEASLQIEKSVEKSSLPKHDSDTTADLNTIPKEEKVETKVTLLASNTPTALPETVAKEVRTSDGYKESEAQVNNNGMFKLSDLNKLHKQAIVSIAEQEKKELVEINTENFGVYWAKASNELIKQKQFFKQSIASCYFEIIDNNINLTATDTLGYELLLGAKQQLSLEIQDHYTNTNLRLQILLKLDNSVKPVTVKTNAQKLQEMIEQYPLLKSLKDTLGLEVELS